MSSNDPTGLLEVTLKKLIAAEEAEKKLDRAIRAGTIRRYHGIDWIGEAMAKGIVTESEGQQLREVEALVCARYRGRRFRSRRASAATTCEPGHNSRRLEPPRSRLPHEPRSCNEQDDSCSRPYRRRFLT